MEVLDDLTHCKCGKKYSVVDSRVQLINGTRTVYRRKRCADCNTKVTTLELDEALALNVLEE